ncbi:hypothetical protein B0H17DRAFT_1215159 [Mycena rosella]|uniref:Uncharacterized protein n=1 Tax=Mycena rosella TaxID=1033263 RepID=A0AAD7CNW9_MYCRO|nr:hypothetical protein B0H17DRAFT_1215159 [Mycena rosella]
MSGSTHSGAVFSPYDLVASPYDPGGEPHIIKTGISLAPTFKPTVTSSWEIVGGDIAAADVQEADEWEDLVEVSSRPASPFRSSLLCLRPIALRISAFVPVLPFLMVLLHVRFSRAHNNAAPATFDNTAMPVLLPVGGIEIRRNKESTPLDVHAGAHRALPPVLIDALASALPHTKAAWVGIKGKKRGGRRVLTVKELKGRGYRLIKWDGGLLLTNCSDIPVIVDQDGRIVCVFVGKPDDPEWDTKVIPGAFRAMERASRKGLKSGH